MGKWQLQVGLSTSYDPLTSSHLPAPTDYTPHKGSGGEGGSYKPEPLLEVLTNPHMLGHKCFGLVERDSFKVTSYTSLLCHTVLEL